MDPAPKLPKAMTVIVDDPESRSDVCASLRKMESVSLRVERLKLGDYLIGGNLLVERKTIADYCVSIKEGRLFRQASELAAAPIRSAIILEGTTPDLQNAGMHREAIQGAIIPLTIVFGLPLLRSRNPEETARLLLYAAGQLGQRNCFPLRRRCIRCGMKYKQQMFILEEIPGIGPFRAEKLLDQFGSIRSVFLAAEEDLKKVPGIGRKTAATIIRVVN